nr:MAG TPA: hypothetical protein [Bacteriophage sp.]
MLSHKRRLYLHPTYLTVGATFFFYHFYNDMTL